MSSSNYYITSPTGSDYEGVNDEVVSRGTDFSKRTHRIISGKGENENTYDGGSTAFKYTEAVLLSTKNVSFEETDPSMTEESFISSIRNKEGCIYQMLKFDRKHNIRTFDFILTYTQLSNFQAKTYKAIPITKQYRGSLLFTGCSIIRNTETMEEYPLKLYAKYESIGDTIGEDIDVDAKIDSKGGPTITFKYTYDSENVYLYICSISPFRLIPIADGSFQDISYFEDKGTFTDEVKENVRTISDPISGIRKTEKFSRDKDLWCDVSMQFRDTTICHTNGDMHAVKFDEKLFNNAYTSKETEFKLIPTNDGEQMVIGMSPDSDIGLEIAQDNSTTRFGHRLLKTDMNKVNSLIDKLENKIKSSAVKLEKIPFIIKTSIKNRGKYNVKGEYFSDDSADGFGSILITDIGTYNVITDTFDITEYINDKNRLSGITADTVGEYRNYISNASNYLSEISNGKVYQHVRKTNEILDVIKNIEFENPTNLEVYYDVAYIRSPVHFDVVASFAEFGDDNETNEDDKIIYFCKDGKIKVCGFKDYDMSKCVTYDIFDTFIPNNIKGSTYITKVDRAWVDGRYTYCFGTNNGIYCLAEGLSEGNPSFEIKDAFIENENINSFSTGEAICYIKSDNDYFYIGGEDGRIRIINISNLRSYIPEPKFTYGDSIQYAEKISEDTILFISKRAACTFSLYSEKWNYEGDSYRLNAKFDNPLASLKYPNKDFIIDEDGWNNVPLIQFDKFVFAMGLRNDSSGYAPVYKRLDTITGEVIEIARPEHELYQPALCKKDNFIYMIGGTVPNKEYSSPEELITYIQKFDITTNTWVDCKAVNIVNHEDENESTKYRQFYGKDFHPTVINDHIYVLKPRTTKLVKNEITNLYSSVVEYESCGYDIDISSEEIKVSTISLDDLPMKSENVNIVPTNHIDDKGNVTFLAGIRNVTYDNVLDIFTFNGYDLYRIVLNTKNNSLSYTVENINSVELSNVYSGNNANNARYDMFAYFSITSEYNEAVIYCLDSEVIIYSRMDIPYSEVHMVHHDVSNPTYYPLVSSGEYSIWNNYNKLPGQIDLIHIDNYIIFLGGSAGKAVGYLSLDTVSLIPSPRFNPRMLGQQDSGILTEENKGLKVVSNIENVVNQVSSCKIGNEIYLLGINCESKSDYSAILYKYELDYSNAKIEVVKDLTSFMRSNRYHSFANFTLTPIGNHHILLSPSIGINDGTEAKLYSKDCDLNIFAYNINTRTVSHLIEKEIDVERKGKLKIAIEGENKVIYSLGKQYNYEVTLNGNDTLSLNETTTNYVGYIEDSYRFNEKIDYIIPTVRRGKYAIAAIPCEERIVMHSFDTIDGTDSTTENDFHYTITDSDNYLNPQLFLDGNDLYLSKGYRLSDITIDGVDITTNRQYSTEIYKLKLNESIGIEEGSDNNRYHAVISCATSNMYAPFAVSRNKNIIVFGDVKTNVKSEELINSSTKLIPIVGEIKENTFVKMDTYVTLTGASKSIHNRFEPNMTSMHVDGHELLLVFGGKESSGTDVTKTLDVYDTARHIWSTIGELPKYITNVSCKNNVILGATEEILKDGTVKPYTNKLTIRCKDYNTLSFEIIEEERPIASYSDYAVWAEGDGYTYVYPMTKDRVPLNKAAFKIDNSTEKVTSIAPIESTYIYTDIYKVLGSLVFNGNLVLILFNEINYEISIWKNLDNNWTKLTSIVEPNNINIANDAFTFNVSDTDFIAISNGECFKAKAVLGYVDKSVNNSKGVLVSYIKEDENGYLTITDPETFANIPGDDLTSVDSIEISKDGFTYYSKNNSINGEVRRIFPNNNSLGFGCRRLESHDECRKNVIVRNVYKNEIYTIYDDFYMSKINLDTNAKVDLGQTATIPEFNKIIKSDIINGRMYVLTDNTLLDIDIDNVSDYTSIGIVCDGFHFNQENNSITLYSVEYDAMNKELKIVVNEEYGIKDKRSVERGILEFTAVNVHNNYKVLNSKLIVVSKDNNDRTLYISSVDGRINSVDIPEDTIIDKIINDTVYFVDGSGKIFEVTINDINVTKYGYVYSTNIYKDSIPNDCIIRNYDIIDFENGYRFINPYTIDFNHFCYDNIDISHDINVSLGEHVISVGVNHDDEKSYIIYTSDKETHVVQNRKVVTENKLNAEDISLGNNYSTFVDIVNDEIHLCIVDSDNSLIRNINAYTGEMVTTNIVDLNSTKENNIRIIKLNSFKNNYSISCNNSNKIIKFNTSTNEYTTETLKFKGYNVSLILKISKYMNKVYALCNNGQDKYTFAVFEGSKLDLLYASCTNVNVSYSKIVDENGDEFILADSNNNTVTIKLNDDESNVSEICYVKDYYKDIETVNDRPLMVLLPTESEDNKNKTYDINGKSVLVRNGFITDVEINENYLYEYKFKDFILEIYKDAIYILDKDYSNKKLLPVDPMYFDKSSRKVEFIEIERYYNNLTDESYLYQIYSISGNDDAKVLSLLKAGDSDLDICDELDVKVFDICKAFENIQQDISKGTMFKTPSRTLTLVPLKDQTNSKTITLIPSYTYDIPATMVDDPLETSENGIIATIADMTFVVDNDSKTINVVCFGTNGSMKQVFESLKILNLNLTDLEIECFKLLNGKEKISSKNDRICKFGKFNLLFDPTKNISEFYSKYIGVTIDGKIYNAIVPISEYEISAVNVEASVIDEMTVRTECTVKAIPYMMYKSSNENVVAHMPIVSRLNTTKFVIDHDSVGENSTGEIYAFLDSSLNGQLVRDDSNFYRGGSVVSIINDKIIRINVDGVIHSYSISEGTLPFNNKILPLVMTYGNRKNKFGIDDTRYYSFVDVVGNVSTYDKELETFIDIDGNVDVSVPFFSTEVKILSSKVSQGKSLGAEVWAYSNRNPYLDISDSSSMLNDFVKRNDDLLN